jgi:LysM repeat protein
MRLSEFLNEAPAAAAAPAPAVPAQPAAAAPVAAKPAVQQPFKPTQVMDPQQAAAANKAAQEFMQGLMAQLQQIKPVAESRKLNENWFTDKVAAAANWVQQKLKENPLIEIGLRFLPVTSTVLAITDVIGAIKGGNLTDATRMLANLIPGGQQLAQAVGVGQAVASGDIAGAAQTAANAAGLKDVASGISAGQVVQAVSETAEINRILQLSGMELIAEGSTKSITVQRGDTLGKIARDNSTTVDAIVKLNAIANPDRIYPGDVIRIPTGQVAVPGGRTKRQGNTRIPDRAEKLTTTTSTGNPKIAMEFFLDQGWTPEQAAGLVANLQAESYDHIDPAAENSGAYGIAQWRGSRKRDFEREMGQPIKGSSLDDQLKFVQWELNNTEKRAGRLLKKATTAAEAAEIVDEFYERSGGAAIRRRIALANSLMTAFA